MDLRIGAISAVDEHGRKVKGPGICADVLQADHEGALCPRDGGLLVMTDGEEFIVKRCVNCGWRKYSAIGKLVVKISQGRALAESMASDRRITAIGETKRRRNDGGE